MSSKAVCTALLIASAAGVASADVVVGFNFNSIAVSGAIPTPHAAEYGIGEFTTNFPIPSDVVSFSGTLTGALPGDAVGRAPAFRIGANASNNGNYAQFVFDASGYADMTLTLASRKASNGGFTELEFQASGNGTDFVTLDSFTNNRTDNLWELLTIDLSAVDMLENNANAVIRIVFKNASTTSSGTSRSDIDNLIINGTLVPAPASAALLGLGGLVAIRRRRA